MIPACQFPRTFVQKTPTLFETWIQGNTMNPKCLDVMRDDGWVRHFTLFFDTDAYLKSVATICVNMWVWSIDLHIRNNQSIDHSIVVSWSWKWFRVWNWCSSLIESWLRRVLYIERAFFSNYVSWFSYDM